MTAPFISRLRLSHYRNYPTAALDLDQRHVVLTGPNGSGKTNILEAISLFSPGRGLRRAGFDLIGQTGSSDPWAAAISIETSQGPVDIGTGPTADGSGRRVRINGANAPAIVAMTEYVRIAWLTPDMDALFRGPASDRRRFLDRLVATLVPGHLASVSSFETAMRQRNKLLETNADPTWLDAIEAQMAEHAAAMYFSRVDALSHLQALAAKSVDEKAFPASELAMTDMADMTDHFASSAGLEEELRTRWRNARPRDAAAGRALDGPHRIDFEVTHSQKQMPAAMCSTGEQKALLIGLILAHARLVATMTGITPILLLDEVAAHLDPDRRQALFAALDALGTQCWMTGTDDALFAAAGSVQHYHVAHGTLSAA